MRFSDDAWQIAKIGDVLTIERGGSPRPIQNFVTRRLDGINWIKIGDTSDDGYIYSAKEKIIPEGAKRSRKVKAGDLLLSNSMSFGKPYILKIDGCIHDGWLVIRDIDSKFNKEFLRNYLGSSFCISQYKKLAAGGVVTNLNKDLVCSAIIKYPPIASQEKIASFLCILDEKIRTQNKIIKELETYKSAIENMIFKSINFPLFAIGDLCKITTGKLDANATVSGGMYRFYNGGEFRVFDRKVDMSGSFIDRDVGQLAVEENLLKMILDHRAKLRGQFRDGDRFGGLSKDGKHRFTLSDSREKY